MGDLSAHFDRKEFACRCGCGKADVDPALVKRLEKIREHFGKPIIITSACRCAKWNKLKGGMPASQHLLGTAADIVIKGVPPKQVADYIEKQWPYSGGCGRYMSFTHIDVRGPVARWRHP
ncbi:TPA: DUF882 domain-containing protein [Enterobacter hormaechei subsp. xiangfangensis]|nr:DUF882 domain-containing protein [Enterobacter hormaechei subsp. xiangfangensis]